MNESKKIKNKGTLNKTSLSAKAVVKKEANSLASGAPLDTKFVSGKNEAENSNSEKCGDSKFENCENAKSFIDRPELLIEYLPHDPYCVLQKVFRSVHHFDLFKDRLWHWLDAFVYDEETDYEAGNDREAVKHFYDSLFLLIDALYRIKEENRKENHLIQTTASYLSQQDSEKVSVTLQPEQKVYIRFPANDEPVNPWSMLHNFCRQYPLRYVRRELWCFLEASNAHSANNPMEFSSPHALQWYEEMSALAEAAYILYGKDNC